MSTRKVIAILGTLAVVGAVGTAITSGGEVEGTPVAIDTIKTAELATTYTAPTSTWSLPKRTAPAPIKKSDPYSSNGTWTVPGDIAYGDYRVIPDAGSYGGGWTLCADIKCEIGTDGFVDNDFITGPGFISIDSSAKFVELVNVTLEPVA